MLVAVNFNLTFTRTEAHENVIISKYSNKHFAIKIPILLGYHARCEVFYEKSILAIYCLAYINIIVTELK